MRNKECDSPQHPVRLAVMGSTGSIGTQTLDIVDLYPQQFEVVALTANRNWELLARQAMKFNPRVVVIADEAFLPQLREALKANPVRVLAGRDALEAVASLPEVDLVVGALVGFSGLRSTIAALEAGKRVALANKETLVVAGEIIDSIVKRKGKRILPVDSEHSAIFQCLWGEAPQAVMRLILTASGGPFRELPSGELQHVTVRQALRHPNWNMGAKVTIDSATMMNKGFEMIEASWLFNTPPERIDVLVHPESVVHSMVEFIDGSVKAQMGLPDMHLPIAIALFYPRRPDLLAKTDARQLNLATYRSLTFEEPDTGKFPLLKLAYDVAAEGGLMPALMNAANEVAVKAFLDGKIGFRDIYRVVAKTVEDGSTVIDSSEVTLDTIQETHGVGTDIALIAIDNTTKIL